MKKLSSVCVISSLTGFLFFLTVSLFSLDSTIIELLEPVVGVVIIVTTVVGLVCLFILKARKLITFKWWHFMWCVIVMCYLFRFIYSFHMIVVR
jgi:hypothetical protein